MSFTEPTGPIALGLGWDSSPPAGPRKPCQEEVMLSRPSPPSPTRPASWTSLAKHRGTLGGCLPAYRYASDAAETHLFQKCHSISSSASSFSQRHAQATEFNFWARTLCSSQSTSCTVVPVPQDPLRLPWSDRQHGRRNVCDWRLENRCPWAAPARLHARLISECLGSRKKQYIEAYIATYTIPYN